MPEFPGPMEQPRYYHMLANIGEQTKKPQTALIVSVSSAGKILGAVVYFEDMMYTMDQAEAHPNKKMPLGLDYWQWIRQHGGRG